MTDFNELLRDYQNADHEVSVLEQALKEAKLKRDSTAAHLRTLMLQTGLSQVSAHGLYTCSLVNKSRFKDTGGFIPWALNGRHYECLTVSVKNSGVSQFLTENPGLVLPGLYKEDYTTLSFRAK